MNDQEIFEYNRRQVNLLKEKIYLYRKNQIPTKQFIDDTDALISWIKNPPDHWTEKLNSAMWEIEIIYATARAHNETFGTKELERISKSVNRLEELVLWYEKNFLPIEE